MGSGNGQFSYPLGVAFDSSGNVHIADYSNYRIQVFTPEGKFICKFGSQGSGPGQFNYPYGVALDSSDMIYVADCNNYRICVFSPEGQFLKSFGGEGEAQGQFKRPRIWFVLMKMVSFLLVTVKTVVSRCSNDQLMYYLLALVYVVQYIL